MGGEKENPYGEGDDSVNTPPGLDDISEDEMEDAGDHGDEGDEEPEYDGPDS